MRVLEDSVDEVNFLLELLVGVAGGRGIEGGEYLWEL